MTIFDELRAILPQELRDAIDAAIADGRFETFSELLIAALWEWHGTEVNRQAHVDRIRRLVEEAREGPTYSSDEVFADLRARIAARQARLAAAE
jgi:Arc/MetJ-type ribon-helix-helix transcriptional regulator